MDSEICGRCWSRRCAAKLVLIVSADDLRRQGIRLSRGFSWESSVEDLRAELAANPALAPLVCARHLLVTFGSNAAFWMDRDLAGDTMAPRLRRGARGGRVAA